MTTWATEQTDGAPRDGRADELRAKGLSVEVLRSGAEVAMDGRLDARSANHARAVLESAVDDGVGDLVLHVGHLELWDAVGLGVLVGVHRRARRAGRRLVLTGVHARQARILHAVGLARGLVLQRDADD
jgi:anti-sigma B factor antagonist